MATKAIAMALTLSFGALFHGGFAGTAHAHVPVPKPPPPEMAVYDPEVAAELPPAGPIERGIASFYADYFAGRPMANGEPFDPQSATAASTTLPIGTIARVTNLDNGKSTVVTVRDHGPYVPGRIIDLSPRTAQRLGMVEDGLAEVEVVPIKIGYGHTQTASR